VSPRTKALHDLAMEMVPMDTEILFNFEVQMEMVLLNSLAVR